jgi:formiminotetrahydrofolate cyclodeaminase
MNKHISAFLKVLDPFDNATGGGTASAVAGAMAAALVGMVARLSLGKKGLEPDVFYSKINLEAQQLAEKLLKGSNNDSEAFEQVQAAFRLPKETEDQKVKRKKAIEQAMIQAATVPLENAKACLQVLKLRQELQRCFNPNAASDLECAAHLAKAGLLGCLANVEINLSSIKDEKMLQNFKKETELLRNSI